MNRADKRNALDIEMIEGLVAAAAEIRETKGVRAVVLTGAGESFCAGLDIATMPKLAALAHEVGFKTRTHGISNLFQACVIDWAELPVPVIAAVRGHAFGGGFQIMLGADMRVAHPEAKLAILEGKWGIIPDMGGMLLMRRLARGDVIRKLTYTAELFSGEEGASYGFITETSDDPLARATEIAQQIAAKSPDAVQAAKALITATELTDPEETLILESAAQEALVGQPNQMEAVMAGMTKRTPKFTD